MKFKIYENLGHAAAIALRAAGHDVSTVFEQGMISSPDSHVYVVSRGESRALVTLDTDFADPFAYPPVGGPGIAVIRAGNPESGGRIRACMKQLISKLSAHPIAGQLWIVEVHRVREYRTR